MNRHRAIHDTDLLGMDEQVDRKRAARVCGCSVDTIKRRHADGQFPGAVQVTERQTWIIPVRDLVSAGLLPVDRVAGQPTAAEAKTASVSASVPDDAATGSLREELAAARADVRSLTEQVEWLRAVVSGRAAW